MKNFLLLCCIICLPSVLLGQVDLNVAANGQMYVSKSAYVYVDNAGAVTVNAAGQIILDSDSNEFSNLYVTGATSGDTAEYWRWTATAATRDLISAPVSGEAYNVFHTRNASNLVAGTQPAQGGDFLFGTYVNTSTTGEYYESLSTDTYTIDAGVGYRAATGGGGATLQFKGEVASGNVTVPITYGGASARFPETNLIGNPYTTYISARDFVGALAANAAIDNLYSYIYGYDGSIGTGGSATDGSLWERINLSTLNAVNPTFDQYLAPGQGFIVYADAANAPGNIQFTSSMQRVQTGVDDFIAGRANAADSDNTSNTTTGAYTANLEASLFLQIQNNANTKKHASRLYFFDDNVSRGLDSGWDAGNNAMPSFGIATILADATVSNAVPFDIQSLDSSDLNNVSNAVVIPVFVNAASGISYTISITDVNNPTNATFYLEDTVNNTLTLLNDNDYTFTASTDLVGAGRFYLRTSTNALSTDENSFSLLNIKSILNAKTLKIEGQLNSKTQLSLYDIAGRLITTYTLNADAQLSERFIDVSSISDGMYVAKLANNVGQSKSSKIIIK